MNVAQTPGLSTVALRILFTVAAWVRTRAFSAPPWAWRLAFLAAVGATAALLLTGQALAAIGPGVAAICLVQPLLAWRRFRRPSAEPLIVLARFTNSNPAYQEIATVHIREVERRLNRHDLLKRACEIRMGSVPLSPEQATRVLRHSPAVGVLSGTGLTVGGEARWEGWAILSWPATMFRAAGKPGSEAEIIDEQAYVRAPERAELAADASVPTSSLAAETFSANHAKVLEGVVLACVADWTSDLDLRRQLREAALEVADELPLVVKARLMAAQVAVQLNEDGDLPGAIRELERLGDSGLQDWAIWDFCFTLMLNDQKGYRAEDRLRIAKKGVQASPDHAIAQANLGATHMVLEQPDEARGPLQTALEASTGREPAHFYPSALANLYFVGGDQADWAHWKLLFRKVRWLDRRGLLRQIQVSDEELDSDTPPSGFGQIPRANGA